MQYFGLFGLSNRASSMIGPNVIQAIIDNTNVIISLKIRSAKFAINKSIHLKKTVVVFSYIVMIVFVHHANLSITRDFLFELMTN